MTDPYMPPTRLLARRRWRVGASRRYGYALLLAGVFLAGAAAGASRVALARLVRDELGASILVVSSLTSWFMAARAAASILGGVASQASPRAWRLQLALAPLAMAATVYAVSRAPSVEAILALNAAWGFLAGLTWPQAQSVASLTAPGGRSGAGVGLYFAVGGLGISAGQFYYGVSSLPDRMVIAYSSALYAASAAMLAAAARTAPHPGKPPRGARGLSLLRRLPPVAAWVLLAAFAVGYSSGILREFLYVYLGEAYGLTRRELGTVLSAAGVLALAGSVAVGAAADRLGTGRVLAAALAAGVAGNLLLASPLGAAAALAGLSAAMVSARSSLPLTRNAAVFPREWSLALVGASNTISSLGMMTGPLVAGKLYEALRDTMLPLGLPGSGAPFLTAAAALAAVIALYPVAASRAR